MKPFERFSHGCQGRRTHALGFEFPGEVTLMEFFRSSRLILFAFLASIVLAARAPVPLKQISGCVVATLKFNSNPCIKNILCVICMHFAVLGTIF